MKVRETKEASKGNKSIKDIILKLNKSFVDNVANDPFF